MFPQLDDSVESHMTSIAFKAKEKSFPHDALAYIFASQLGAYADV